MRRKLLNGVCSLLVILIICVLVCGRHNKIPVFKESYDDGVPYAHSCRLGRIHTG